MADLTLPKGHPGKAALDHLQSKLEYRVHSTHDSQEEARDAMEGLEMNCELSQGYPPVPTDESVCNAWIFKKDFGIVPPTPGKPSDRTFILDLGDFRYHDAGHVSALSAKRVKLD